jgi:hypothetical protein
LARFPQLQYMGSPNHASQLTNIAFLDEVQLGHLLYGLAYAKTIATVSKIDYRFDDFTRGWSPTAVTYGENYDELTFRRWVKQEYAIQVARFNKAASDMSAAELIEWIGKQWVFRMRFFRTFQDASAELAEVNRKLQNNQLMLGRLAAIALVNAQMALVMLGAPTAPAVAGMLPSMVGWSAWATAGGKIALGLGTGIAVSVAGTWSTACEADVVMVGKAITHDDTKKSASDGTQSGLPGFVDDLLAPVLRTAGDQNVKEWETAINKAYKAYMQAPRANKPQTAANLAQLRNTGPAPLTGKALVTSNLMKGAGYLFCAKSLYDAGSTFVKQWNGEL